MEALPDLRKCLSNKRLLVRIAAIKALGRLGGKEAVAMLVARLPQEKGRAAWEIARSLKKITARSFGIDSNGWQRWWRANEATPLPPQFRDEGAWSTSGEKDGRYAFYGLDVDSHNVVFVLDTSGSMVGKRISKLKVELTKTLKSLSNNYFINLVFFNTSVNRWRQVLTPLKTGGKFDTKASALAAVRYLDAQGLTNLYGALRVVFRDEEVDSIILLSDGNPTAGAIIDPDSILDAVKRWNRTMQITIHVVAIGSVDRYFMRQLALITNGTFISL